MMTQTPEPGSRLLTHCGDTVTFTLHLDVARSGRAVLRTSIGGAETRYGEEIEAARAGRPPLAVAWRDIPMEAVAPGRHRVRLPLLDEGCFQAKACFFPAGGGRPEWPDGDDVRIKTGPAWTVAGASIYTAFPRQFGPGCPPGEEAAAEVLDQGGWTVIPPSGTFRDLVARLDVILDAERFRILQLLPIHPVPTTFARMGRYGSPFASTDFLGVNPAYAVFDRTATPLDQFRELVDAVHARGARIFLDLPANHTGWASILQIHHPEWFRRTDDGHFQSPGAWGTVWEDLVELDYDQPGLRAFMADVFLFWCGQGVDGFRCDAGYMVPQAVWTFIVAQVRLRFPETVFLLEGLGGKLSVTRALIGEAGLDWAYSELFQTEARRDFERELPGMLTLSAETGPLVHFAETHDNNRLAARSPAHARMRTALAALLAHQGCFGITNGVEWFADEKIDVHGANALRWGADDNQVGWIARLNTLIETHPAFAAGARVAMVQGGEGNTLAIVRTPVPGASMGPVLILVNLNADGDEPVHWPASAFEAGGALKDLLGGGDVAPPDLTDGICRMMLAPARVLCVSGSADALSAVDAAAVAPRPFAVPVAQAQHVRAVALRIRRHVTGETTLPVDFDVASLGAALAVDPVAALASQVCDGAPPPVVTCRVPEDAGRVVMIPPGQLLLVQARSSFSARITLDGDGGCRRSQAWPNADGGWSAVLFPGTCGLSGERRRAVLHLDVWGPAGSCRHLDMLLCLLPDVAEDSPVVPCVFPGSVVRAADLVGLLTNGRGAMAHVRARWGEIRSQYDALLAANPDPRVPCDRQILWTRCRAWIVNAGYSTPLDAACLDSFSCEAGSGTARWIFRVPVGTGRSVSLAVSAHLHRDENRVSLLVERQAAGTDVRLLDDATPVQLILRPDIESRSFHGKTKAFTGPEHAWPRAVQCIPGGFAFRPGGRPGLTLRIADGAFVPEPEWHYLIAHPEDAARGLDGHSDLFSPGWFTVVLGGADAIALDGECVEDGQVPPSGVVRGLAGVRLPAYRARPLRAALSAALRDFIVRRDAFKTVIAGYPWFLDWGRDTFIVLRGMIADGLLRESLDIVRTFGVFERDGTLPNMINGANADNRDTSDAPLWYLVAVRELARKLGGRRVLETDCGGRTVREVLLSIGRGVCGGTPTGIRLDDASGLVYSPSHFTWMDTNHPAGTPRAGYPVEIQALWIAGLNYLARIDKGGGWRAVEARARAAFVRHFWREDDGFLSDCLHAASFCPAAAAVADDHLRCNQLFAITLGALTDPVQCRRLLRAAERLLVPGGIRTLDPGEVRFRLPIDRDGQRLNDPARPYWGRYAGDEDTRRKPAYHNGTAWSWPFPAYAEALVCVHGEPARPAARALIASAAARMQEGCVGHLPEIMDGDAPHVGRGCDAQAWGASEFLRLAILLEFPA